LLIGAPAEAYVSALCYDIFDLRVAGLRTSELLLCSDKGLPDSEIDMIRAAIGRRIRAEE
jgi:hypothetical protein